MSNTLNFPHESECNKGFTRPTYLLVVEMQADFYEGLRHRARIGPKRRKVMNAVVAAFAVILYQMPVEVIE